MDMEKKVQANFILVNDVWKDIKLLEITVMSVLEVTLHIHRQHSDTVLPIMSV